MLLDAHVKSSPLGVKPNTKNDKAHKRPPKAAPNVVTTAVDDVVNNAKSSTDALHSIARILPSFPHVSRGADWVVEGVLATLQRFSPFRGVSEAALDTVRRDARGMVADCLTGDCTAVGVVFAVEDYLCTIANEEEEEERLAK